MSDQFAVPGGKIRVLLGFLLLSVAAATSCSPHGSQGSGQCALLKNCPQLREKFRPLDISNFIEDHSCGVYGGDVLVCCPLVIAASGGVHTTDTDQPGPYQSCGSKKVTEEGADWPFIVALGETLPKPMQHQTRILCNGALVTQQWIITNGDCVVQYSIDYALLSIGLADRNKILWLRTDRTHTPRNHNIIADSNSVGLVKLARAVELNANVQVACLPLVPDYNPTSPRYAIYVGMIDDGSGTNGFEVTSHWKHRVPLDDCRTSVGISVYPTDSHLCSNGLQACANVSIGRPLFVALNGEGGFTLVGIGGQSRDLCTSDVTTYTAVSQHLPWIYSFINPTTEQGNLKTTLEDLVSLLVNNQAVTICGRRRITQQAIQWPFVVSLGDGSKGAHTVHCSGVLLQPSWVLTDARCLTQHTINHVLAGDPSLDWSSVSVAVSSQRLPPNYSPSRDRNSVALVQLAQPLQYTEDIQPVCVDQLYSSVDAATLQALAVGHAVAENGELVITTGWEPVGRTGAQSCQSSRFVPFAVQDDTHICTTNIKACVFLATPSVLVEEIEASQGLFRVVGVGGDNANYCNSDYMAFVKVRNHIQWIQNQIGVQNPASGAANTGPSNFGNFPNAGPNPNAHIGG